MTSSLGVRAGVGRKREPRIVRIDRNEVCETADYFVILRRVPRVVGIQTNCPLSRKRLVQHAHDIFEQRVVAQGIEVGFVGDEVAEVAVDVEGAG